MRLEFIFKLKLLLLLILNCFFIDIRAVLLSILLYSLIDCKPRTEVIVPMLTKTLKCKYNFLFVLCVFLEEKSKKKDEYSTKLKEIISPFNIDHIIKKEFEKVFFFILYDIDFFFFYRNNYHKFQILWKKDSHKKTMNHLENLCYIFYYY